MEIKPTQIKAPKDSSQKITVAKKQALIYAEDESICRMSIACSMNGHFFGPRKGRKFHDFGVF